MPERELSGYLTRAMTPPPADTLRAIESGPMDTSDALALNQLDRLLDPAALPGETGWCTLTDGVGYVAVQTAMAGVSAG